MAKKTGRKRTKKTREEELPDFSGPWIGWRKGLVFLGFVSLATVAYFTWQLGRVMSFGEALLWGLGYGVGVWIIFGLALAFNKWVRGR